MKKHHYLSKVLSMPSLGRGWFHSRGRPLQWITILTILGITYSICLQAAIFVFKIAATVLTMALVTHNGIYFEKGIHAFLSGLYNVSFVFAR